MANYELVVNSKFQPFSFERYIQPYQIYGEAYKELENQYGELATKSNIWEEMANEQTDPYAYKMYKNYANDLEEKAGQLAREGLNASSRKDMLNMRARYAKEITPIEQAYTARLKLAEQQQQALLQDPTLMFSRTAATTSLDDYIRNPQLGYDPYSGKMLTAQVAQAATALAKQMRDNPRKWRSILHDSYYETLMQKGFKTEDVLKAIQGHPEAAQELTRIVEDAVNSSGIKNWNNPTLLKKAYEYAKQGLWGAVGETQYQILQNQEYLNPLQRAQLAKLREESNPPTTPKGGLALNPSNIYSNRELSLEELRYKNALKKYSKYFDKDANGLFRLNLDGLREYRRKIYETSGGFTSPTTGVSTPTKYTGRVLPTDFKILIDSLGGSMSMDPKAGYNSARIGNLWARYTKESPASKTAKYDAMKTTEYIYDVPASDEYQNNFKSKLSRVIGSSGELVEVDYDTKSNTWVPTGKTLSFNEFDTKDYKLVARAPSEIGNTWFIKKSKETAKRYLAVPGMNITAEGGRDQAISERLITQRKLQDPNLTPQQRVKLENHYDNLAQQQAMFESQIDLTNQTGTQSFNPYYVP